MRYRAGNSIQYHFTITIYQQWHDVISCSGWRDADIGQFIRSSLNFISSYYIHVLNEPK